MVLSATSRTFASRTIILFKFHMENILGQREESSFSFGWKENKSVNCSWGKMCRTEFSKLEILRRTKQDNENLLPRQIWICQLLMDVGTNRQILLEKQNKTSCQVRLLGLGDCPYFSQVTWLYFSNCFSIVSWSAATINYKSVFWGTVTKLKNNTDLYSSFTITLSRLKQADNIYNIFNRNEYIMITLLNFILIKLKLSLNLKINKRKLLYYLFLSAHFLETFFFFF